MTEAVQNVTATPAVAPAPPVTDTKAPEVAATPPAQSKLDAASAAAERARRGSAKQKELQAKADALAHNAALAQHKVSQLQRQVEESSQLQRLLRENPVAALEKLGIDGQKLPELFLQQNSVEAVVKRLEERLNASEKARQDEARHRQEQEQRAAIEANERQAETKFLEHVTALGDPWLSNIKPDRLVRLANSVALEVIDANRKSGRPDNYGLSFDSIVEYLRSEYGPKTPKSDESLKVDAPATEEVKAGKKKPSTLTNKLGTTVQSMPADFDKLPDREQRRLMAEQMAAVLKPKK